MGLLLHGIGRYSEVMWKRIRGISIAETLIGIFLLALLITVFFNLFPTTVLANRKGTRQLQASDLAHSTLAELRTRPFAELTAGLKESLPDRSVEGTTYQISFEVEDADFGDPQNLKVVTIRVQWTANNQANEHTEKSWIHKVMEEL